jgi:transposase-like protein
MKKRARTTYSDSFKADAVQLYNTCRSYSKVAADLGISDGALRDWVAKHEAQQPPSALLALSSSERDELDRLRKDNKRLLMERDILKKAAAFFAKENA